ncbi:DNA helicase [Tanacetum coccineum]
MAQYLELTPTDRADIVCRVFKKNVKDFLSLIHYRVSKKGVSALSYAIVGRLEKTLKDAPQIDEYISAEIPDPVQDPRGPDRILAKISNSEASTSAVGTTKQIDEIRNYVDCRFICPFESCWRIFDFPIHCREPAVQILNVHLEDIGCKSPDEVRTVNVQKLPTFRAACEALGLLGDDKEWDIALEEPTASATSKEIIILFAQILIYCDVADLVKLWAKHWEAMQDDIPVKISKATGIQNYHDLQNNLLMEEKNYKCDLLKQDAAQSVPKLNRDQKTIYDLIIGASLRKQQELLFIYGHGGTGKTFLWKTIITSLRSEGKIVLAVASSSIASLLLPERKHLETFAKWLLDVADSKIGEPKEEEDQDSS